VISILNDKTLKMWDEIILDLLYLYTDLCKFRQVIELNQTSFLVATSCETFKLFEFWLDSTKTTANITTVSQFSG